MSSVREASRSRAMAFDFGNSDAQFLFGCLLSRFAHDESNASII